MFSKLLIKCTWAASVSQQQDSCLIVCCIVCFIFSLGFITDGNSFLLGNVLLRQIRIPNDILFPVSLHEQMKSYPQHQEDRENYGAGWVPPDTNITKADSMWHYQSQESLGSYPIPGELATYSGGGYVVRLGRNASAAAR